MAIELRPQTIGALLDRAITVYARHLLTFVAAYGLAWIPALVLQLATLPASGAFDVQAVLSGKHPAPLSGAELQRQQISTAITLLVGMGFAPAGYAAVIAVATGYVDDATIALRAAFARALAVWVPGIAVIVSFAVVAVVALIGAALVPMTIALLGALSRLVVPFGMLALIVFLSEALVLMTYGYVAFIMAFVILVTEDPNPVRAIGLALRRTLDRRLRRRSFLVGLGYTAIEFAGLLVFVLAGWLVVLVLHAAALGVIVSSVAQAVLGGLGTVFIVLYTRDVRVRREGADLLHAVETSPPQPPATRDDGLDDADHALLEQFLTRREQLAPEARAQIAARLSERVRPKLRALFAHLDDEALFEHLARPS